MAGTKTEIHVASASLFSAQVLAREPIAAGLEAEVQKIREFISAIVPDVDDSTRDPGSDAPPTKPISDAEQ